MDMTFAFSRTALAAAAAVLCIFAAAGAAAQVPGRDPRGADSTAVSSADGARIAALDTAAAAPADTSRRAARDTLPAPSPGRARVARPDSAFVPPEGGVWTMEELKSILGAETAGFAGKEYRQRRSGRVAMLCALAFPGLGQMYNEKPVKAAIAMGAETFYTLMIYQNRRLWSREQRIRDRYPVDSSDWRFHDAWVTEYWERSVDWIWWSSAAILVIVIDAFVDAHLDDMRFEIAPRSSRDGAGLELVLRW